MRPYDPKAKCPKCGNASASSTYHEGDWRNCPWACPGSRDVEHVLRHCQRCHYQWAEAPLDARPSSPEAPTKESDT